VDVHHLIINEVKLPQCSEIPAPIWRQAPHLWLVRVVCPTDLTCIIQDANAIVKDCVLWERLQDMSEQLIHILEERADVLGGWNLHLRGIQNVLVLIILSVFGRVYGRWFSWASQRLLGFLFLEQLQIW